MSLYQITARGSPIQYLYIPKVYSQDYNEVIEAFHDFVKPLKIKIKKVNQIKTVSFLYFTFFNVEGSFVNMKMSWNFELVPATVFSIFK